jgi:hypothetical protein
MIFDVLEVDDKNDHAAADTVCKSIIATLHPSEGRRD